ncbi:hypothetical protein [Rugamonas rubra]|uniref:hypothetical protein n=1 Tax=Rugamonas rubra TaxID=758825 RepID=UPI000B8474C0|nr:hypothetical protein [Rugamonas rubra]
MTKFFYSRNYLRKYATRLPCFVLAYAQLLAAQAKTLDPVVAHGDACLPKLMADGVVCALRQLAPDSGKSSRWARHQEKPAIIAGRQISGETEIRWFRAMDEVIRYFSSRAHLAIR